ncbi:hypothetical protein RJ640_028927 [Escallonia rubra]|uniref:BED-type domain-containing protein n=1 Tax=Escallonia rubra TaxID=112253 RepID=A0AA88RDW8_9ASTE|nr:hypothetical protein RJ640_028927 [Escallonia rubra]
MCSEEIELSSASSISNNSSRPGLSKSKGKAIIMSEPVGEAAIGEVEVNTMFKRRERKKTSPVWDFFVDVTLANGTKKVKCKLCNAILNKTKGGTTTQLLRHRDTYCPKRGIAATNQSVINVELGKIEYEVSKKDFKYNHAKVREAAAQMILVHEYPFNMMEHEFFNRFMMTATPYYETLEFKQVFPRFFAHDANYLWLPEVEDWRRAEEVCKFLEIFREVTDSISGTMYPTANMFLLEVLKIKEALNEKSRDENSYMRSMAMKMKEKFDKYWGECNLLMAIAAVLDPRSGSK